MTVPQSLLVAALALAWLIVLVPMVSRKGRTVEETVEGRGFRVLQRNESSAKPSRFRRRSLIITGESGTSENDADDSESAESVDSETVGSDSSVLAEYPQTEAAKRWLAAQQMTAHRTTGERDTGMTDLDEDHMSTHNSDSDATAEIAVVEYESGEYAAQYDEATENGETAEYDETTEFDATAEFDETPEYDETDRATYSNSARDATADDREYQPEPVSHENHRRQGRGGFDPEAAEAARRFRYAKRQRVALILLVLAVVFGGAAVIALPTLWIGAAISGLLLVAYLSYLRRQVRIEEEVRQRRLARLQRARQIRPERYNDAPVEHSHVPEYATDTYPVSQIPGPAYDRRGRVVVDLEDDDPGFDDLDQYEPIVYKRASGQ